MFSIAVFFLLFKEFNSFVVLPSNESSGENPPFPRKINFGDPPKGFDWRVRGHVSPIKNQGQCNACWAFSTIANIESHRSIYLNAKELLSEQFLLDCDEAKKGCADASLIQTFADIVTKFGGVLREDDYYPYVEDRKQCRWVKTNATKYSSWPFDDSSINSQTQPVPVVGFQRVHPDEESMVQYLYEHGPLSVAINSASMAKYDGGIDKPTEQSCNPRQLDHAVLIVGYDVYELDTGETLPYWIIKNSWGTEWGGEDGWYYLVRGRNACGIATDVSFAYVT